MKRTLSVILCILFILSAFGCFASTVSAEEITSGTIGSEASEPETAETGMIASDTTKPETAETGTDEPELPHVPQIRVVTENGNGTTLQKEDGYVNATIEITGTDGAVMNESIVFKVRGNGTALESILKKAFTFKFSKKRELLGLGKGKKWALLANAMDVTQLRTCVAMDLAHQMGIPYTSDYRMVELWVDDSFRGLYQLIEPIQAASDRVDIDIESNNGMNDFMLERERGRVDEGVSYIKPGGIRFGVSEPEEPTSEQLTYINNVMTEIIDTMKTGTKEEISAVVDIDSFAKFYLLNEYVKTTDFDYSSVYFYYKDGKLCAGPPWDYDHSMGSGGDVPSYAEANRTDGVYAGNMHFYQFLCQYDWFMDEVKQIYAQHHDYFAAISADGGLIDSLAEEYSAEIERNFTETPWKVTRQWSAYQRKPLPTYQENLDFFKNWCENRLAWMNDYLSVAEESPLLGDANGDGVVSIDDTTVIQRAIANLTTQSFNETAADVDSDGRITILDTTYIQRFLANMTIPVEGIGDPIG